ncbi:hypothetical protein K402DRAFT_214531 [Aulographum hederae CBS 113979]|uniref:Uncharacterized protein n=1 Tax=Aulographum hederae CBS 113979 TaxID=1176131 RepID=A0A6G1GMT3_9PEZI|nr:hypothetical protein K402DRAFT_214531 [Aulographum hederae CBS 113979]
MEGRLEMFAFAASNLAALADNMQLTSEVCSHHRAHFSIIETNPRPMEESVSRNRRACSTGVTSLRDNNTLAETNRPLKSRRHPDADHSEDYVFLQGRPSWHQEGPESTLPGTWPVSLAGMEEFLVALNYPNTRVVDMGFSQYAPDVGLPLVGRLQMSESCFSQ